MGAPHPDRGVLDVDGAGVMAAIFKNIVGSNPNFKESINEGRNGARGFFGSFLNGGLVLVLYDVTGQPNFKLK